MKKLFTFCLSLVFGGLAFTAQAQVDDVFQFCYEDGTIVPDGSTVVCDDVSDYDPINGAYPIYSGLYIKNAGGTPGALSIKTNIRSISGGALQFCFPTNCDMLTEVGERETARGGGPVSLNHNLQTEFFSYDGVNGYCEVTYQVFRHTAMTGGETFPGSTITVIYTTIPTSIDGVEAAGSNEEVARYTLDGRKLSAPQKGVNIVKYADGSTKKVVVE